MGLLADYLPNLPTDPNQNSAARQGLLQFGAALLGGKGNFGSILGQGLAAGAGGYNSALQSLQQKALLDAQTRHMNLIDDAAQADLDQNKAIASALADPASPSVTAAPAVLVGSPAGLPQLSGTPQASPAPDGGKPLSMVPQSSVAPAALPQVGTAAPAPVTEAQKADRFEHFMALADRVKQYPKTAKIYYDMAEKFKPEVLKTETLTQNGQPVSVITFKDGSQKVSSFGALPNNQVVDTGGEQILIDKNTGKKGANFAKSVSPDSVYSRGTQYGVQGMIDRRAKEEARTQVVQSDDGPLLVDKTTGTGKAITGPNGERVAGVTKPLNDSQSKALLFGTRMQEADKILASLAKNDKITTSKPYSRAPVIGGVINAMSDDGHQMLDQAKRDFINAVLRRESGAAISPGEFDSAEKQYFPQIGEGEKVIEQKARARALAIKGMLAEVPEKQRASITPLEDVPKKPAEPIKVSSAADYDKVPVGAEYIAPDGTTRRKK